MTAAILFMISVLSFILSAAAPSSGAEKLRVAYPTLGPGSTPSWVTHEMGFWKKSGLDVELILLSGGARMLPALISGSVDIILGSDTGVTMANLQGANLVRIGVTMNSLGYSLVTQPGIRSIQDLKGKVLGTGRGRDASYARLVKILSDNGLNPASDVKFLPIGETPTGRLQAIKSGLVQGAVFTPPLDLVGSRDGLRILHKIDVPTLGGGINTTAPFVQQNRKALADFSARLHGRDPLHDHAQAGKPESVLQIFQKPRQRSARLSVRRYRAADSKRPAAESGIGAVDSRPDRHRRPARQTTERERPLEFDSARRDSKVGVCR